MNAVEAVEQLGTMGRKLQAREMGLRRPVAALRQAAEWEKVLGNPVAALSQVLGAAGGPVRARDGEPAPAAAISSPGTSLPLAPFRWEEDRPPAGSGMPAGRSGIGSEFSRGIADGTSVAQSSTAGSIPGPVGGIRLARRQTSLLGILNANLEDRVYAQAGEHGSAAALPGEVRSEDRPAAGATPTAAPPGPRVGWRAVPVESRGAPVPAPFAEDEVRQAARTGGGSHVGEAESTDGGVAVDRGFAGDAPARMNVWGYESLPLRGPESTVRSEGRGELAAGTVDGVHTGMSVASDEELVSSSVALHNQARTEGRVVNSGGWPQNADVAPAAQDGAWTAADAAQGERPLSMAQIEQVLAALDERLELGLLRLYGAAGGLP